MTTTITLAMMKRLWPNGNSKVPGLMEGIVASVPSVLKKYSIKDDLVVAHAMAQFSHECNGGLEMVENVHYTAKRAAEVWPLMPNDKNAARHFANADDCYAKCKSFPGDPDFVKKLINLAYGTRMGNRSGTNDGYLYIGRGLAQTTGHDGYKALGDKMGYDFLSKPEDVIKPSLAFECGIADLVICGCIPYALADNILGVSALLNVGHLVKSSKAIVGYSDRVVWLKRWKAELAIIGGLVSDPPTPKKAAMVTIAEPLHDEESETIKSIQTRLDKMGYHEVGMLDGKWGGKTAGVIAAFKNDRKIEGEPVIDKVLTDEMDKSEAEGFKRAIAPERAEATEATVAAKVPEIIPVKRSRFAAFTGFIGSIFLAIINALADYFKDALAWVIELKQYASDAPAWVWFILAAVAAGGMAFAASRGANGIVEAFRKGERA